MSRLYKYDLLLCLPFIDSNIVKRDGLIEVTNRFGIPKNNNKISENDYGIHNM